MVLDLPYSPAEATARLAQFVARSDKSSRDTNRPLRGEVSPKGFRLGAVTSYQSSFSAWAEGTFTPTPDGCRLEYRTGTSAWSFLFMLVWFGMLLAFQYSRRDPRYPWWEMLTHGPDLGHLWFMLAFGVIFVAVGYGLAAKEVRTIDVTLRRALAAEPAR
jgi:hypothetical protein